MDEMAARARGWLRVAAAHYVELALVVALLAVVLGGGERALAQRHLRQDLTTVMEHLYRLKDTLMSLGQTYDTLEKDVLELTLSQQQAAGAAGGDVLHHH